MNLTPEFTYCIATTNPLSATTGSPFGERMYASIVEGKIEGPRLRASRAAPGSDWMGISIEAFKFVSEMVYGGGSGAACTNTTVVPLSSSPICSQ
jgi:hypothetical protein